MKQGRIIFDNGGGATLQLEGYAHYYENNMKQLAADYNIYLNEGVSEDWEGHEEDAAELEPTYEEIANGGYMIYTIDDIAEKVAYGELEGSNNVDDFLEYLRG